MVVNICNFEVIEVEVKIVAFKKKIIIIITLTVVVIGRRGYGGWDSTTFYNLHFSSLHL